MMADPQRKEYFHQIEENVNQAVISNDIDALKQCITEDWDWVDTQGGIIRQERCVHAVEQRLRSHSTMTKEVLRVKVYGEIALVTGRGKNSGRWQGEDIEADEWVTDVYKKEKNTWLCVLTHLTPVKKAGVGNP